MFKRTVSLFLCALLALSLPLGVLAAEETVPEETLPEENPIVELTISTAEEFLVFAENCRLDSYSRNLHVALSADLDLTGLDFTGIPTFSGSFDGNDHTICGFSMTVTGSVQGLFRYLTDTAEVENLHVQAEVLPDGSQSTIGGIAGSNAGRIRKCSFFGVVSGADSIGGIAGINTVTGIIDGCQSDGSIQGNHFVGGIAGKNQGVVRNCENLAAINTTAKQNSVELSDITLESITQSESSATTTDVGGIAGHSTGVIRRCVNRADVGYRQMGYNIGGIAGTQSGYIADCENYGAISGRKEVGGIAGQMEPAAKIEYSIDTLQILEGQLETMSGLTAQATANAQSSASSIAGDIASIRSQVQNAQDAIDQLVPSADTEEPGLPEVDIPDRDALLAAQNTLSSSMTGMQSDLRDMASTAQGMVYNLSRDMKAITNQIDAMSQTISTASEGLGGSITDISDTDTDADTSGEVAYCENYGTVLGDRNVGGITGAIAMENDLDVEDDWDVLGESSLNFESELRAVILSCGNTAQLTVNKQSGGGIAGLMTLGLVKNSANSGAVLGESADYTGGIAGQSEGFIRACSAKCIVAGSRFVGGIAGSGVTVTDCRSMNRLTGTENLGAVLGFAESRETISGNYYIPVDTDPGAIDAISYDGCAQSMEKDLFLALTDIHSMFRNITVTFRFDDGSSTAVVLPLGSTLEGSDIPELPVREGFTARWEGMEEGALLFDHTVQAVYTSLEAVLSSQQTRSGTQPILLAQGSFTQDQTLEITELTSFPHTEDQQTPLEGWQFHTGTSQPMALRYHANGADPEHLKLLVRTGAVWEETAFTTDGSYLVFSAGADADAFCCIRVSPNYTLYILAAVLVLAVTVTAVILICKKRKKT